MSDTQTIENNTQDASAEEPQATRVPAASEESKPAGDAPKPVAEQPKAVQSDELLRKVADLEARVQSNANEAKQYRQAKSDTVKQYEAFKAETAKTIEDLTSSRDAALAEVSSLKRANVLAKYPDGSFDEDAMKALNGIDDLDTLALVAARMASPTDKRPGLFVPNEGRPAQVAQNDTRSLARSLFSPK